jgi:hypothetical protein
MSIATNSNLNRANTLSATRQGPTRPMVSVWTGRAISALIVLFLFFDGAGKLAMPPVVIDAFRRLGFPVNFGPALGAGILLCAALYAIPRTAVLGLVLLTAFFGGAVAVQLRAGSPLFETIFPMLLGVLAWAGLLVRECRLRAVFPFRRSQD